jgi:type I restriction-modification system DNA methylase subunit
MARKGRSTEEIIGFLREAEVRIAQGEFESFLFKAADILRGKMGASEFKEFIFGLLCIKRLSDEFDRKRQQLRKKDFAHIKDQAPKRAVGGQDLLRRDLFCPGAGPLARDMEG